MNAQVVDAVHAKGSYIFCQLWALGRAARPAIFHERFPDYPFVAPSPIPLSKLPDDVPRELTLEGEAVFNLSGIYLISFTLGDRDQRLCTLVR